MPEANLFLMFTQRLNTLGVAYMVSGSVAVIIYGEPRLTHDVDLIVVLNREHIARLPEVFPPAEFYCPPTEVIAVEMAREQRGHFNIIHHETGFKAHVYLSGRDPLHAWGLARARQLEVEGQVLVAPPSMSSCASSNITRKAARRNTYGTFAPCSTHPPRRSKAPNLNSRLPHGVCKRRGAKFKSAGIDFFHSALKRHRELANASGIHQRHFERSRPIFSSLRR